MYQSNEQKDKFMADLKTSKFMLSATDNLKIAWIRRPFITLNELNKFLQDSIKEFPRYTNIEIYNEITLDELIKVESVTGEWNTLTLRCFLFGESYQSYASQIREPNTKSPEIEFIIQSNCKNNKLRSFTNTYLWQNT